MKKEIEIENTDKNNALDIEKLKKKLGKDVEIKLIKEASTSTIINEDGTETVRFNPAKIEVTGGKEKEVEEAISKHIDDLQKEAPLTLEQRVSKLEKLILK